MALSRAVPRATAGSVDELVAGVTRREVLAAADAKSGSVLERVEIGGRALVLKVMHPDGDWIGRTLGDLCCWPVQVWASGLLDLVPPSIDHAVVGAADRVGRHGWGGALLMEDVGPWLIPEGDEPITLEEHAGFISSMADLQSAFWGFQDDSRLLSMAGRFGFFSPGTMAVEEALGFPHLVPRIAADGWGRLAARPGPVVAGILDLWRDPQPLVTALAATPQTFLQGDWKLGNLGRRPDGRTILLDWAYPGQGPATWELTWYLALNAARLPETKEATVTRHRRALEARGVEVAAWWDRQLALALLAGMVVFGWEKVLGSDEEFGWWLDRAGEGLAIL